VIPALLALIGRLALRHQVHVFALAQEPIAGTGISRERTFTTSDPGTLLRAIPAILRENRAAPFDIVHSMWSGWCGLVAAHGRRGARCFAGDWLRGATPLARTHARWVVPEGAGFKL
jgi:hypothetical protein